MSAPARRLWLTRLTGLAALLLVGATWPLWLPPTPDSFPQLPLLAWLIPAPAWCDRAALGGALLGAAGMIWGGNFKTQETRHEGARPRRFVSRVLSLGIFPTAFTLSLAFAIALNQIRLQVWAHQFLLLGGVLSLCPRTETGDRAAVTLARVLAVGILFHSALSKLDLSFAEGPGRWLIGGFLGLFGADTDGLPKHVVGAAAFAVPAWELGLSVLLAVPSLRRAGLAGAVLMHVSVTATLWKLDQSWGVILWNLFFLAHEFVLFWPEGKGDRTPLFTVLKTAGPRAWPTAGLILAAVLLPFGTRAGYWDVWPGWAVYAGGVPRAVAVWEYPVDAGTWTSGFVPADEPLDVGRSALRELDAPLPQDPRVRTGVAIALLERGVTATTFKNADWQLRLGYVRRAGGFGSRSPGPVWEATTGSEAARRVADGFLLNARPRALSLPPNAR